MTFFNHASTKFVAIIIVFGYSPSSRTVFILHEQRERNLFARGATCARRRYFFKRRLRAVLFLRHESAVYLSRHKFASCDVGTIVGAITGHGRCTFISVPLPAVPIKTRVHPCNPIFGANSRVRFVTTITSSTARDRNDTVYHAAPASQSRD